MDILINMTHENYKKVIGILKRKGYYFKLPLESISPVKREERLRQHIKLSPQKKLEWLYEMQEFIRRAWTKKQKAKYWKLRQANAWGQGDFW
jgi:hypothetical protein